MAEQWADGPARRLDKLLEAAEIKNVDLARALDLDPSTISKYRSGERVPQAYELAEMIERASGSADEVLGLKPVALEPAAVRALSEAAETVVTALRRGRAGKR